MRNSVEKALKGHWVSVSALHMLPVSSLNQGQDGRPKTAIIGGVERNRIAYQAIKRAIRMDPGYRDHVEANSIRTKRLPYWLANKLSEVEVDGQKGIGTEQQRRDVARSVTFALTGGKSSDHNRTASDDSDSVNSDQDLRSSVAVFFSQEEVYDLVESIVDHWDDILEPCIKGADTLDKDKEPKNTSAILAGNDIKIDAAPVIDISMMGRDVFANRDLRTIGGLQMAHAFGVHPAVEIDDFFSLCDDLVDPNESASDHSGADHIGHKFFSSACIFRSMRLDLAQFAENLEGNADKIIAGVESVIAYGPTVLPNVGQNRSLCDVFPSLVHIEFGKGSQFGYADAYHDAITDVSEESMVAQSVQRFADKVGAVNEAIGDMGEFGIRQVISSGTMITSDVMEMLDKEDIESKLGHPVSSLSEVADLINSSVREVVNEGSEGVA